MKKLTVLYDAECGLCQNLRAWLQSEPTWFPVEYLELQAEEVDRRWPGIRVWEPEKQILAIDDQGGIYQGGAAWITLLYALRNYRETSFLLADPAFQGLVQTFVEKISKNRHAISDLLRLKSGEVGPEIRGTRPRAKVGNALLPRTEIREEILR